MYSDMNKTVNKMKKVVQGERREKTRVQEKGKCNGKERNQSKPKGSNALSKKLSSPPRQPITKKPPTQSKLRQYLSNSIPLKKSPRALPSKKTKGNCKTKVNEVEK